MAHELDQMYVFVSQGTPKEGCADDYLRIAIAAQQAADGHPGLIQYQVLTPQNEGGPITLVSTWENKDAFKAWIQTDAFQEAHGPDVMRQVSAWTTGVSVLDCDVAAAWHAV